MSNDENQTDLPTGAEGRKPEWRLSLARDTQYGTQWAGLGVGWLHKDGQGVNFTNDLLKMYGF